MSCINSSNNALFALLIVVAMPSAKLANADEGKAADASDEIVFVPPKIGTPKDRIGAGTRGSAAEDEEGALLLLAPEDGGLTTLSSPPLVWHLKSGHRGDLVFALNSAGASGGELLITGPFPPGYYGVDLGRLQQHLETGTIYEWQILLLDSKTSTVNERSIRLVERVPEEMNSGNPSADGLWFDALSPLVKISLSGRVKPVNLDQFEQLLQSAGVTY